MQALAVVEGRFISPHSKSAECTVHDNLQVSWDRKGVISKLSTSTKTQESDLIWLPGFVDTHVHFPQHRVRARSSGALLPWLEQTVFPEESKFRSRTYAAAVAQEFCAALLANGTTCAQIFSSSDAGATDELFAALDNVGLRAQAGLTLMDQGAPEALCVNPAEAEKAIRQLVEKWHQADRDRLRFVITPRFALSCSTELLEVAGRLSHELSLPVQTHLSENNDEIKAVAAMFPQHKDYLSVYEHYNLAHERTIFAHCIHLSDSEWTRLEQQNCSISHCPDSNNFLGSGHFPWQRANEYNVRIGLGSDVGAGRTYAMRKIAASSYDFALVTQERKTPNALLWHATRGGALAVNRPEIGCIEPGFDCDLIALNVPHSRDMSEEELFDAILFRDDVRVHCAYVRGRKIFSAHK
ncbi:MAG: guanine deaminase [Bradymonadia bacterium]